MAEKWATADKLAGRTVIIMGDFNKSDAALKSWADINGLYSLSRKLAMAKNGEPFASFNGTSTVKPSHIDHIYLQQNTPLHADIHCWTNESALLSYHRS
jgi:endonuclease/exonuclease/phosphatase family metal-dependent hydrolase